LIDQSQEILLGHAIFASSEYGYYGYRHIARSISNKIQYIATFSLILWCWACIVRDNPVITDRRKIEQNIFGRRVYGQQALPSVVTIIFGHWGAWPHAPPQIRACSIGINAGRNDMPQCLVINRN